LLVKMKEPQRERERERARTRHTQRKGTDRALERVLFRLFGDVSCISHFSASTTDFMRPALEN
jgi:hypothetical protein